MSVHNQTAEVKNRPLPLRMRRDLAARKVVFGGRGYWNIKDPLTLRYFQLRDEEYFILSTLDGRQSVDQICRQFDKEFAPNRLGDRQLQSYLATLHSQGLVVADAWGQANTLLHRKRALQRGKLMNGLAGILAVRFRGVDPERFLLWLYPKVSWLFSRWTFAASSILMLSALLLLIVQYEAMLTRLPGFYAFFNLRNLVWIVVATGLAKVLHELGHALTCKHFGGECHEMGVMLLVFTPCLYCNVSDAWLMKNKRHRLAISAAGIYVELVLAAICTFLWWFSEPGLLNTICLNTMFVCSASTLLFNGNPLLRYDGYYVLADLVEIPNLRQRGTELLSSSMASLCLGTNPAKQRMLPDRRRVFLMAYTVASITYRAFVVVAILWFLHLFLKPYGLAVVAQLMTVVFVITMVLIPLRRFAAFLRRAIRNRQVKPIRTCVTLGLAVLVLFAVFIVRLPHRVAAPAIVEPSGAQRVYVSVAGRIPNIRERKVARVDEGDFVTQGEVLVQLVDPSIRKEITVLEAKANTLRSRIESLKALQVGDDQAGVRLPTTLEALRHIERQLEERKEQERQLTLTAPVDGVILPDERQAKKSLPGELLTWHGTPLDIRNAGCTLESGTTFCLIGDPRKLEAILVVDQADIEFVKVGQQVSLWLKQLPGKTVSGTVAEISDSKLEYAPDALLADGELSVVNDQSGFVRPASSSYHVRVVMESSDRTIPIRSTGWAKVSVKPQSIAQRVYRYLCSTFGFAS